MIRSIEIRTTHPQADSTQPAGEQAAAFLSQLRSLRSTPPQLSYDHLTHSEYRQGQQYCVVFDPLTVDTRLVQCLSRLNTMVSADIQSSLLENINQLKLFWHLHRSGAITPVTFTLKPDGVQVHLGNNSFPLKTNMLMHQLQLYVIVADSQAWELIENFSRPAATSNAELIRLYVPVYAPRQEEAQPETTSSISQLDIDSLSQLFNVLLSYMYTYGNKNLFLNILTEAGDVKNSHTLSFAHINYDLQTINTELALLSRFQVRSHPQVNEYTILSQDQSTSIQLYQLLLNHLQKAQPKISPLYQRTQDVTHLINLLVQNYYAVSLLRLTQYINPATLAAPDLCSLYLNFQLKKK